MRKKILFTIQWYGIPATLAASANALCDELIIDNIIKNIDCEIHILSYGLSGYPLEETIDGVKVYRFKRSWFWNQYIHTRNGRTTIYAKLLYRINRILMRVKQFGLCYLYPNYEPILVAKFVRKALKMHKKYKYDLVISEFNGVDSLKAGLAIKKMDSGVLFMPICWDSIAGGRLVRWMPKQWCLRLRRKLENEVMSIADQAIVMKSSWIFHQQYTQQYDYYKKFKILDVPYLNIPLSNRQKQIKNQIITGDKGISLLYSGTMGDRDPLMLLTIFDQAGIKSRFTFVTPQQYHNQILKYKKQLTHVEIECLNYMAHSELEKLQMDSDILINFGVSNANAVSGKIFDYMRLGKPIISTIKFDNEACIPYLKAYPQSLIVDERQPIETEVQLILKFIEYVNNSEFNMHTIMEGFADNTPDAYSKEIISLLEK